MLKIEKTLSKQSHFMHIDMSELETKKMLLSHVLSAWARTCLPWGRAQRLQHELSMLAYMYSLGWSFIQVKRLIAIVCLQV